MTYFPSGPTDLSQTGTLTSQSGAGSTVTLTLGTAQGTWGGQIIASGSALSSVLQWEYSVDGGTTYQATSVRSSAFASGIGSSLTLSGTAQTMQWRGSCSGWTHVRVHCPTYHAGDTIGVTITASTATDIPTGIAQDGTDSSDANATQATGGVGIRGWLSTLVSLFRAGTAKVTPQATEAHLGEVGSKTLTPTATFTRPADTTAYAAGDLVANSTTAGSVAPMQFAAARVVGGSGMVRRVRIKKSTTGTTNASFTLYLYSSSPALTNGDNGAWLTDGAANYLGKLSLTIDAVFSDGAVGIGVPAAGSEINFAGLAGTTIYGLLAAAAAYGPGNAEVFTLALEVFAN